MINKCSGEKCVNNHFTRIKKFGKVGRLTHTTVQNFLLLLTKYKDIH